MRLRAADLGLAVLLYQPFRDFEAVPDDMFRQNLRRAERKLELMASLGAEMLLVCSNVSAASIDDDALAARLLSLADRASADVRGADLVARTVTVKLRDADFTTRQASRTLGEAVRSERAVYAVARQLLARLRTARRVPARLLGVALSHFEAADGEAQLSLLEPPEERIESERDRAISRAIDQVRERFGRDALGRGGQGSRA